MKEFSTRTLLYCDHSCTLTVATYFEVQFNPILNYCGFLEARYYYYYYYYYYAYAIHASSCKWRFDWNYKNAFKIEAGKERQFALQCTGSWELYPLLFVCVVFNFNFWVQIVPLANKIIRACRPTDWRMKKAHTCNITIAGNARVLGVSWTLVADITSQPQFISSMTL